VNGRSTDVTEKELRALTKHEMLELLLKQEVEIEKLAAEKAEIIKLQDEDAQTREKTCVITEASLVMTEVMSAAQNAAEIYLANERSVEAERRGISERIERHNKEAVSMSKRLQAEMQSVFDWHLGRLIAAKTELSEMIKRVDTP